MNAKEVKELADAVYWRKHRDALRKISDSSWRDLRRVTGEKLEDAQEDLKWYGTEREKQEKFEEKYIDELFRFHQFIFEEAKALKGSVTLMEDSYYDAEEKKIVGGIGTTGKFSISATYIPGGCDRFSDASSLERYFTYLLSLYNVVNPLARFIFSERWSWMVVGVGGKI